MSEIILVQVQKLKNTIFDQNTCIGTIDDHFANGGAIYLRKPVTFTDCTFTDNGAKGTTAYKGSGGAIYASSNASGIIINGCTFIHNYSKYLGGTIYLQYRTAITINDDDTNPTVFKFNYGYSANGIYLADCNSNNTFITINSNVYFNNSVNDTKDSEAATYRAKIEMTTPSHYESNNDIYTVYQNILFNYEKNNDTLLADAPPSEGSNLYYADKYTYAVIRASSISVNDTKKLFREKNESTNHLHKFIKTFNSSGFYYEDETYQTYAERVPVFNKDGIATFHPYASDLLQVPENLKILVSSQADLEQLLNIYKSSTASKGNIILQTADITCSSFSWTTSTFMDLYDGQNYKIKNLSISDGENNNIALFSKINGATLKNIILDSPIINATTTTPGVTGGAALVHSMMDSKVINCSVVNGKVTGKKFMGGLVGFVTNTSYPCYIINSSYQGSVILNGSDTSCALGGILAYTNGGVPVSIINCFYKGEIQNNNTACTSLYPAGIAQGLNSKNIYNCYVSAKFTGNKDNARILVGSAGYAKNCYVDKENYTSTVLPSTLTPNDSTGDAPSYQNYSSDGTDDILEGDLFLHGNTQGKMKIYKYSGTGTSFTLQTTEYPIYTISGALNKFVEVNNAATNFVTNFCELKPWVFDEDDGIKLSSNNTAKDPTALIFPEIHEEPENATTTPIWIRHEEDFLALDGWNKGNTIELKNNLSMDEMTVFVGSTISNQVSFTLNGNNNKIEYTIYSTKSGYNYEALIGYANDVTIKDLNIRIGTTISEDFFQLDSDAQVGSFLIARMKKGTIENCNINVHNMSYKTGDTINCSFGCFVGEIVDTFGNSSVDTIGFNPAENQVTILNCTVSGAMCFDQINAFNIFTYGGFIGKIYKTTNPGGLTQTIMIDKCKNLISDGDCSIGTSSYNTIHLAGFVGSIGGSRTMFRIRNCLNKQEISLDCSEGSGYSFLSGFVNLVELDVPQCSITNCVQAGAIWSMKSSDSYASGCITTYEAMGTYDCYATVSYCAVTNAYNSRAVNYNVVSNEVRVTPSNVYYYDYYFPTADINYKAFNHTSDTSKQMEIDGGVYKSKSNGDVISSTYLRSGGIFVTWQPNLEDWNE